MSHSTKFYIYAIAALPVLLGACGNSSFPSDGFKSTKFGMNSTSLESIGFTCGPDKKTCEKKDKKDAETLFGKPADVYAELTGDKTTTIKVRIGVASNEMVDLFVNAIGSPKTYEYTAWLGDKIRQYYWISSDETSIVVTVNLDEKPPQGMFKIVGPRSTAEYLDKTETTKLLERIKKNAVKPKDI